LSQKRLFGSGFFWAQSQIPEKLRLPCFLLPEYFDAMDAKLNRALTAWMEKNKPQAIFHDALALPEMLVRAGYRIPEDVAIAGTTVMESEPYSTAGIDQNSDEIGRAALLVLLSQIHDNAFGLPAIPRQMLVQGSWVDGPSLPRLK
jgi:DNA-binding LacI/PurR family transcriptional regulator